VLSIDEEDLRYELKYVREGRDSLEEQLHSTQRILNSREKTIEALQRDLGSRSDNDLVVDETTASHLAELEKELEDKSTFITELQDKHRETCDDYDELKADHEKMRQKYYDLKRRNYRKSKSQSIGSSGAGQQARQRYPIKTNDWRDITMFLVCTAGLHPGMDGVGFLIALCQVPTSLSDPDTSTLTSRPLWTLTWQWSFQWRRKIF